MRRLVTNEREWVCQWAAENMHCEHVNFDRAAAIGLEDDGVLVAAAVFNQFNWPSIAGHIVSDGSRRWACRLFLKAIFDYPFRQLNCARVSAPIAEGNAAAINFVTKLGFVLEGRLRKAMPDGSDRLVFGLLKEDCKWVS